MRGRTSPYADNFLLDSEMGWELFQQMARIDPAARPRNVSKSSTGEELQIYAQKAGFVNVEIARGALFVTMAGEKPDGQQAQNREPAHRD
jgi:hypothetical protein